VPTVEELKEQQRKQWSGNAAGWDSQHEQRERETAPVSEWLCREAHLQPGMIVVDLACGSGHPALDIARIVGSGGKVVATDLVPEMVEVTRRRAAELELDNLETRLMDAEALDFPDDSCDAVTCRFGLMFCPEPERALSEIRRVLKPGGRLALSVWSVPEHNPGQTVQAEVLRRFGRPQPAADFDAPGVYQLAPEGKLEGMLRGAGFGDVRVEPLPLISEYASLEVFLSRAMRVVGLRAAFEEATPEEAQRLKSILAEVLSEYTYDGVIRLTLTPLCATATS
jgi:SAM-dependent methyltransferase